MNFVCRTYLLLKTHFFETKYSVFLRQLPHNLEWGVHLKYQYLIGISVCCLLGIGNWLLATGYRLLVIGNWMLAMGYGLWAIGY